MFVYKGGHAVGHSVLVLRVMKEVIIPSVYLAFDVCRVLCTADYVMESRCKPLGSVPSCDAHDMEESEAELGPGPRLLSHT